MPKPRDFLDVLSALHALMRELRGKSRAEVEPHFDNPKESPVFMGFPRLLANKDLLTFICDYGRLIIIGNAKTHEIEALMDEELETLANDRYKPVDALQNIADSLPALGIVAAVLGIVHAMGSLDSSPVILGGLIGAALVGTFSGILLAYAIVQPVALKIKSVRQKQLRMFSLVKQSLLAFMNGAMPQVAVEFGRKTIPSQGAPDHRHRRERDDRRPGAGARSRGQGGGLTHAPRGTRKLGDERALAARRPARFGRAGDRAAARSRLRLRAVRAQRPRRRGQSIEARGRADAGRRSAPRTCSRRWARAKASWPRRCTAGRSTPS